MFQVRFHGTETYLKGLITGVHHLYIEDSSYVQIYSTAQTAQIEAYIRINKTEKGNISFPSINIRQDGHLDFYKAPEGVNIFIDTSLFENKYKGKVTMNHAYVKAYLFDVESEADVDLEGGGYPKQEGKGAGSSSNGGSYGGYGGSGSVAGAATPYGSLFTAKELGSGGGGSCGGSGGGFLHVDIGKVFHVDGEITLAGSSATGSNCGGGSGGSLLVVAYNMSGHGDLRLSGGNGLGNGGGGSGGRMSIEITFRNKFGGNYIVSGGNSAQSQSYKVGASGTVYKYESDRGPQYRDLKYNPRLNATLVEAEHTMVVVDNLDYQTLQPAVLMEENTEYYEFDEVQVEGYTYMWFYHPDNTDIVNVVIHELKGNKKGVVVPRDNQRVVVNFVESTHSYLDAPCGFEVHVGAEIVFPTEVIILAESVHIKGRMTGVETMYIEEGGTFQMSEDAHTGVLPDLIRWYEDTVIEEDYTAGLLDIAVVHVNNGGEFWLSITEDDVVPSIEIAKLDVKNGGLLNCDSPIAHFSGATLVVEKDATFEGTGAGSPAKQGCGAGGQASNHGGGGGHGGKGGNTNHNIGGTYCGTMYKPIEPGSGGGGNNGGSGGAAMKITYTV